ncbi:MAG: type IV pili methyl-accepting chemotaxis transducer N-terminal domain-containing protein [Dechloromonas sp.]|nr:type IV pili methyl-accepting chemotaxis transducer N-terminal domain-containing protein [Dechloromonas sp.]
MNVYQEDGVGADILIPGARDRVRQHSLLSRIPLLADLPALQLNRLAGLARIVDFAAHDFVFRAGEPVGEAYLLVSGSVKRSTLLPAATEKVIELVQTPQILSMGEVFAADTYASSGEAMVPTRVIAIAVRTLRSIVCHDRELSWRIIRALAQRQYAAEFDSTGYHYGLTGTQRVLDFLVGLAGQPLGLAGETTVTLKTSKKIIAARIGMTPESFSRSLRQLSESGMVVVEGRDVHIQNAALLDTEIGDRQQRLSFSRKPRSVGEPSAKPLSPGSLINLCGRPRMLAQRMATNWALLGQNITPSKAATHLRQLKIEFERTLARLDGLGLPPDFAACRDAVIEIWAAYRPALFDARPSLSGAGVVLEHSEAMLAALDRLTDAAESVAGRPAGHDVNIAGRNRMLSQRIAKLVLFRAWGMAGDLIAQKLGDSLCEFDVNLVRLKRSGASVPELAAQLDEVTAQWQFFESIVLSEPAAATGTRHVLRVLAEGERLFRHLDTAVKLFERLAK